MCLCGFLLRFRWFVGVGTACSVSLLFSSLDLCRQVQFVVILLLSYTLSRVRLFSSRSASCERGKREGSETERGEGRLCSC
jgi:hypothetical protein